MTYNKGAIPIIGAGRKQEATKPKADQALHRIENLAKHTHQGFQNLTARIEALENLTAFMLAEKSPYDIISEYELIDNLKDMSYAAGLIWFNKKTRKFYQVEALMSRFTMTQGELVESDVKDADSELTYNWKAVNEKDNLTWEIEGVTEALAYETLELHCQDVMKQYHDTLKESEKEIKKDSEFSSIVE
jgi:hypothetical protein